MANTNQKLYDKVVYAFFFIILGHSTKVWNVYNIQGTLTLENEKKASNIQSRAIEIPLVTCSQPIRIEWFCVMYYGQINR